MHPEYTHHKGRTDAYLGTVDHHSAIGKHIVDSLRRECKRRNKLSPSHVKRYVKLQGRLGKDNPNADKYRDRGKYCFGSHSHQCIKLADAAHADIYIYRRWNA